MEEDLGNIVFTEERQQTTDVSEEIVFGRYVSWYEINRPFVRIVLSFISQITLED